MTTVVYIAGYARSGSTLLDRLLGAHPNIVSTGELNNFQKWGFLDSQYCSCGVPVSACPFWTAVNRNFLGRIHHREIVSQVYHQNLFERLRYSFLRPLRKTLLQRQYSRYVHQVVSLYEAIAAVSEAPIIVDSSKRVLRALNLSEISRSGGIRLKIVHLVRDGRGVVWSLKKSMKRDPRSGQQKHFQPRSVLRTAVAWRANARNCRRLVDAHAPGSSLRVRYEDLCLDPTGELRRLAEFIEVDRQPLLDVLNGRSKPAPAHLAAGSRHRMQEELRIQADTEWVQGLSKEAQRLFWWIAGSEASQLGYSPCLTRPADGEGFRDRFAA